MDTPTHPSHQIDHIIQLRRVIQSDATDRDSYCWVCTDFNIAIAEKLEFLAPERLDINWRNEAVTVQAQFHEVLEAARDGCNSCLLLRECIVAFKGQDVLQRAEDVEVHVTYRPATIMTVSIKIDHQDEVVELFPQAGEHCPWLTIGPQVFEVDTQTEAWPWPGGTAKRVPISPLSNESLNTVREWLEFCSKEHPWCDPRFPLPGREPATKPRWPKRLLFVGERDSEIRLHQLGDEQPQYSVLSYCWGSSRKLLTLKSNLQELQRLVPLHELVKTCQDAVHVTRQLGLQYCWIDSLCIVQDDLKDWETESANMGSIYANAYLCIAATATDDGDAGLFGCRPPTKKMTLMSSEGTQSTIWARRALDHTVFDWGSHVFLDKVIRRGLAPEFLDGHKKRYPLFTRGWTFQERLLSPRILHFTANEMVWECLGSMSCECGTLDEFVGSFTLRERRYLAGVPRDVEARCGKMGRAETLVKKFGLTSDYRALEEQYRGSACYSLPSVMLQDHALMLVLTRDGTFQSDDDTETRDRWRSLISEYSRRKFSHVTDALPAVSGLASRWAARYQMPTKYVAGLWQHDLQRNLLWQCIDTQNIARPDKFLAPTWSWASVRRSVDFVVASHDPIYHADILEVVCEGSSSNPFGTVVDGYLKLRCPMLDGKVSNVEALYHSSKGAVWIEAPGGGVWFHFDADCVPECAALEGHMVTVLWYSTDVNDLRTGMGFERGLVLAPRHGNANAKAFTRIGLVNHVPVEELRDLWRQKTVTIL